MRRRILSAILVVTLPVAGCSRDAMLLKVASPEADRFVRTQLLTLAAKSPAEVVPLLTPRLTQFPTVEDSIAQVLTHFRNVGDIESVSGIAAHSFFPSGSELIRRTLIYQVLGTRGDLLVELQLLEEFGEHYIDALRVQPITPAMRAQLGFWRNLGPGQLLALICMLASVAFMVWTAVQVVRTPMRRRWLWALVAFVGVTKVTMNWTTGVVVYQFLTVQLLGAALSKPATLSPWWIGFTFPAGALLALYQRKRAAARAVAPDPAPVPPETDAVSTAV